ASSATPPGAPRKQCAYTCRPSRIGIPESSTVDPINLRHNKPAQVVRSWCDRLLIQQPVITRGERIVHHHAHFLPGESTELIELTECVEEGLSPGIAATCRVGGFGQPKRHARLELVAQLSVEREGLVRPPEPLLRERRIRGGLHAQL